MGTRRIIGVSGSSLYGEDPYESTPRTVVATAYQTPDAPNPPTLLTLTAYADPGDIWVKAEWTPPLPSSAGAVTQWAVEVLKSGDTLPKVYPVPAPQAPPFKIHSLDPNTAYTISVRAITSFGASSTSLTGTVTTGHDLTAPATVSGLVANAAYKTVTLVWTALDAATPLSPFTGKYIVEQAQDSGFTTGLVTSDNGTSNIWTSADLAIGTTYYFRVHAVSASGVPGTPSSTVTATPGTLPTSDVHDGVVPSSNPSQISVSGGPGYLLVKWTPIANADPVTYEVHVSTSNSFTPSSGTLVATVPQLNGTGTGAYSQFAYLKTSDSTGTALAYGTTYYVTVRAKDADGTSSAGLTYASGSMLQVVSTDVGFSVGNGNYVRNANFFGRNSVDTNGGSTDNIFDDWYSYTWYPGTADAPLTIAAYTADSFYGQCSARLTWTTNTGNKGLRQQIPIVRNVQVWPANTTWIISLWVKNLANPGVPRLAADAGGFTDSYVTNPTPSTTAGWQRWDIKRLVGNADVTTNLYPAWSHANGDLLIGAIQVTLGDTPLSGYSPRPDEIIARSINANQIVAHTLTANEVAANTITANEIHAYTITATEIAANAITAEKLTIGASSPNMLPNPGFEDVASLDSTAPAQWIRGYWWGSNSTTAYRSYRNPGWWRSGDYSIILSSGNGYGGGANASFGTEPFPVVEAETYNLTCWTRGDANASGFFMRLVTAPLASDLLAQNANCTHNTCGIENLNPNSDFGGSWGQYSGQVTVPATHRWGVYVVLWNSGDHPSIACSVGVDDVSCSRVVRTTQIADGAIVTAHMIAGTINGDRVSTGTLDATKIVAGSLTASSAAIASLDASKITVNQMAADRIGAGTIGAYLIELTSGGTIRSVNYGTSGGTAGWEIDGAGNLVANNATLRGSLATVATGSSERITIGSVAGNQMTFYTGNGGEVAPAKLQVLNGGLVSLYGVDFGSGTTRMDMYSSIVEFLINGTTYLHIDTPGINVTGAVSSSSAHSFGSGYNGYVCVNSSGVNSIDTSWGMSVLTSISLANPGSVNYGNLIRYYSDGTGTAFNRIAGFYDARTNIAVAFAANDDTFYALSSADAKKNVEVLTESSLDKIRKTRPVSYQMSHDNDDSPRHIGMIAQEFEQAAPGTTAEGTAIALTKWATLNSHAIQELAEKFDGLEAKVFALQGSTNG